MATHAFVEVHLTGSYPSWTYLYISAPVNATNSTTNSSTNNQARTIMQACGLEADTVCGQTLWPAEFLQDSSPLLLLKGAAANVQTLQQLSTWRASVPPCTNSTSSGSCVLCDSSIPEDMCGTLRASDGAQLCNWRYVECRDRRVVTLNMADQVSGMTAIAVHC